MSAALYRWVQYLALFCAALFSAAPAAAATKKPRIAHVTVVIMENYNYDDVMNGSSAPYMHDLARRSALFTNSFAVTHPSEPNYLALFSGSTQGVTSDSCPFTFDAPNLASELRAHGYAFAGYAESLPAAGNPCVAGFDFFRAKYGRKHVPWSDFSNVPFRAVSRAYDGPSTRLTGDVNFVVPNMCNDMHDCGIAAGDAWLAKNVPSIEAYDKTHDGLLIVTFDEADGSSTNHIVTIMDGPMFEPGKYAEPITHYSVLRFIEDDFALPHLGASATAKPIALKSS